MMATTSPTTFYFDLGSEIVSGQFGVLIRGQQSFKSSRMGTPVTAEAVRSIIAWSYSSIANWRCVFPSSYTSVPFETVVKSLPTPWLAKRSDVEPAGIALAEIMKSRVEKFNNPSH
jgi:hypothetical protein